MKYVFPYAGRVGVVAVAGAAVLTFAAPAVAVEDDDPPRQAPPTEQTPEVPEIDPNAAGLMLGSGAELAEPRVLYIESVTETLGQGSGGGQEPSADPSASPGPEGQQPNGEGGGEQREEVTGGQRTFTLQTDVIFQEGSAEIGGQAREALTEVAAAIEEYQPERVNIFGFTDDQGSYESGLTLSQQRAENTRDVLLDLLPDAGPISFNVRGYSEDYPLYDNETEEGRQRNRRVEISWPTS
ncbi:OmpA family protein [Streptomyces sp. DSM 44917]|uniref:OmpA family protein n=1 Tax=Streptomyces boetiae TaxID=3075541 RepID=A0ABU2LGK4_9ACTN|nr:OmpA family protein [Streptomyces sp. DSM 44917]MDT0310363.1 OmpA family protein [Streptomyces sp. DSM 44917]